LRDDAQKKIGFVMALDSTLYTGLSGLDVNQTDLNVIGNNIANANTVGFKASRALFSSQFYVTDNAGSPADATFGGQNPEQRGLGAVVGSIETDFSAGEIQTTGVDTDMAIDGDGFFVVQGKQQEYTRDGSFTLNQNDQLVNSAGDFVQGYGVDADGNVQTGSLQNITIPLGTLTKAKATENASFQGNLDANGAVASSGSDLMSNLSLTDGGTAPTATSLLDGLTDSNGGTPFADGDVLTVQGTKGGRDLPAETLTVDPTTTVQNLTDFYNQAMGIDTNVDGAGATLVADPSDPTAANLSIVGNNGTENALSLAGTGFSSTNPNMALTFSDQGTPTGESVHTSFQVYDSLGTPITVDLTASLQSKTGGGTTWSFIASSPDDTDGQAFDPTLTPPSGGSIVGNGTLSFDSDGKLMGSTGGNIQITRTGTGAGSPLNVNLDFSQMTALTSQSSQILNSSQDGTQIGTLTSFSIGSDGTITGSYDNGLTGNLGQVAVATFNNPEGLIAQGGNMYTSGGDSGVAKIGAPLSLSSGAIRAGALESSNVDLSKEFINMIQASTGFSASSRVITTADQLITDLLNQGR
jgi:flagellar hook protein FlgE